MKNAVAVRMVAVLGRFSSTPWFTRHASKLAVVALVTLASCQGMNPASPKYGESESNTLRAKVVTGGSAVSQAEVFEAAGDIRGVIEAYRTSLGALNPN